MSGSFVVAGGGAFTATKVGREAYAAQLAEEASPLHPGPLRAAHRHQPDPQVRDLDDDPDRDRPDHQPARRQGQRLQGLHRPDGRRHRADDPRGAGAAHLRRLRDRRHPARPKQCLVQELPAIEGLARVDVVCLDKTGTLTEGGMDVTELRPLDGARRGVRTAGARRPRRVRPAAQRLASRRSSTPTRTAQELALHVECAALLLRPQVQRGRPSARATARATSTRGCWAPRTCCCPPSDPALAETDAPQRAGAAGAAAGPGRR